MRAEDVYAELRKAALERAIPTFTDTDGPVDPGVVGVVVDIPVAGGWATLVTLLDGTTSLFTSTGGGSTGGAAHEPVAAASRALLGEVSTFHRRFTPGDDQALPPPGAVRIHLLDADGPRHLDVPEDAFGGRADHELAPVLGAIRAVMSGLREVPGD